VVSGNTFLMNRHSIAADGELHDSYRASFNLILSHAPSYDAGFAVVPRLRYARDVSSCCSLFDKGRGGNYLDIFGNTFLAPTDTTSS